MKRIHKEIREFIIAFIAEHGYPPTTREIAEGVAYDSPATINGYLREMREVGIIHFVDRCPRTITVPGYGFRKVGEEDG